MKIPTSIQLGGHTIPIVLDPNLIAREDCYGQYAPETLTIIIDSTIPLAHQEEVFWHEVIEAIDCLYELELPHAKIQTLGVALHQVTLSAHTSPPTTASFFGVHL